MIKNIYGSLDLKITRFYRDVPSCILDFAVSNTPFKTLNHNFRILNMYICNVYIIGYSLSTASIVFFPKHHYGKMSRMMQI